MIAKATYWENAALASDTPHILLLAGTMEARRLAPLLAESFPNAGVTASLAGVVRDLPEYGVPTRIGGFGGIDGLTNYLRIENVSLILDVTHPFAAQISSNAATAAQALGIPIIRFNRPEWKQETGDNWQHVNSISSAVAKLPRGARAFLGIGRKEVTSFYNREDIYCVARMIERSSEPLPDGWDLILERPARNAAEELALFNRYRVTHLVTKNSGGSRSSAKLMAARQLRLPVLMIDRPRLPQVETASDFREILDLVRNTVFD